ncbi:hypothetical protein CASFOL_037381 [Castilleja foliolosa]
MGTTGGDRELQYKTVADSKVYAVISPQMGKQVVAFLAAIEIMSEQFPGAFSGYDMQVMESHQAEKLDISGTAKAVISCFEKLGASFDLEQVNFVAALVCGMHFEDALLQLQVRVKRAAKTVYQVIHSARANATHNYGVCVVGGGRFISVLGCFVAPCIFLALLLLVIRAPKKRGFT